MRRELASSLSLALKTLAPILIVWLCWIIVNAFRAEESLFAGRWKLIEVRQWSREGKLQVFKDFTDGDVLELCRTPVPGLYWLKPEPGQFGAGFWWIRKQGDKFHVDSVNLLQELMRIISKSEGLTTLGIAKLEQDTLIICQRVHPFNIPRERPESFELPKDDPFQQLIVFKRVKD